MSKAPPLHSPLERFAAGYWVESRQPLASLVFIAPLLVIYELGVLLMDPQEIRNGADAWLRGFLELIGFGQYFLLPILTVCILLAWHYTTRRPWKISRGLLWGMTGECILLAVVLRLLLQLQGVMMQIAVGPIELSIFESAKDVAGRAVSFLGAGIYEELLFRLILLSGIALALKYTKFKERPRLIIAVIASSLLFSAAHYFYEDWNWFSFSFRCLAGASFAVLFVYRGFGIAAGTHAGYDILVGLFKV